MISGSETLINKVRVPLEQGDALSLRLRLGRVLSGLSLAPAGLSPAAIVCIRRLRDPRPGLLELSANTLQPAFVWEHAVTEKLTELVSKAARSPRDPIPPDAECVVFVDQADLMASLAGDWCEGSVTARWWWQALLKRNDVSSAWLTVWRKAPEYIPAALQYLADQKRIGSFARALSDTDAATLLCRVARSFALRSLILVLDEAQDNRSPALEFAVPLPRTELAGAPWQSWAPESAVFGAGPMQQRFLGIALMIQRAPAKVRTASFASEVDSWQREIAHQAALAFPPTQEESINTEAQSRSFAGYGTVVNDPAPNAALDEEAGQPDNFPRPAPAITFNTIQVVAGDSIAAEGGLGTAVSENLNGDSTSPCRDQMPPAFVEMATESELVGTDTQARLMTEAERNAFPEVGGRFYGEESLATQKETAIDQFAAVAVQTETQLGGVFYLINLAIYLGLYGDFTTPAELGVELNIWDFVALVGRELLGHGIEGDPIWQLMADLAGRAEDTPLGRDFEPADEWRIPEDWLQPFSRAGQCEWTTVGGRLRVSHPQGFALLDIPLEYEDGPSIVDQQLWHELKAYQNFGLEVSALPLSEDLARQLFAASFLPGTANRPDFEPGSFSPLRLWLNRLMPYVRARLRQALGSEATEDPGAVFGRHAKVVVTATHLDVFFALADLPIEIRVAGLDRNPGWVPAAGRFIAFHFD